MPIIRIKRLFKSFSYAMRGLFKTFREEQNLRLQAAAAVLVFSLAAWLKLERRDWLILIVLVGMVMITELVNSAVERVTDVLKPRIDGYVKEIKDIMAAAVLLASFIAAVTGFFIFFPYIIRLR